MTDSPTYQMIDVSINDGVAVVTFNRPERRNAYLPRMGRELDDALERCEVSEDVRAIVVTGAGEYFCPGADLTPDGDTFERRVKYGQDPDPDLLELSSPPWRMSTPIIGAINGDAIGVGITLPLQWDIRIVSATARLSFAFVRRGVIPERYAHWLLPRLVGYAHAADLLLTGRLFTGAYAAQIGLATQAVDAKEVLPTAMTLARDIATSTAPAAVALSKRLLDTASRTTAEDLGAIEFELFKWTASEQDAKEGVLSFLEKRPPAWTGSKHPKLPPELQRSAKGTPVDGSTANAGADPVPRHSDIEAPIDRRKEQHE